MKILIAYNSFTGNTASLAQFLANFLKGKKHEVSMEEIKMEKEYSTISAYIIGCKDALFKATPPIKKLKYDPAQFDCVAVLSPTWASTYVPAITTYLSLLPKAKKGQIAISGSTGGSVVACGQISRALKDKGYKIAGELPVRAFPKLPNEDALREKFAELNL